MPSENQTISITRPDDWHIHLREGVFLKNTVADAARQFSRAIVMPNLKSPVVTLESAKKYQHEIVNAIPEGMSFRPLMTLYLTDNIKKEEIAKASDSGIVYAAKLYPAGATTNSDAGVTQIQHIYPVLETMEKKGMPLLVHGEVTDQDIDIFDREAVFIERILIPVKKRFPGLKVVLEHITTKNAVEYVTEADANVAATITAHHLMFNRNHMLVGGIKPHYYCLPVLKRNCHQLALIKAATSGLKKFFLGTDSAPHTQSSKESPCGCAGSYTAHAAMSMYTQVFDQANALDKLELFASFSGADFYGLPRNQTMITLEKTPWQVPDVLPYGNESLVPLCAGETLNWQITQF